MHKIGFAIALLATLLHASGALAAPGPVPRHGPAARIGLTEHILTTPDAFARSTSYTDACPPPPGTIIHPFDIAEPSQWLPVEQSIVQCDGHWWYEVPIQGTADMGWIEDIYVAYVLI